MGGPSERPKGVMLKLHRCRAVLYDTHRTLWMNRSETCTNKDLSANSRQGHLQVDEPVDVETRLRRTKSIIRNLKFNFPSAEPAD